MLSHTIVIEKPRVVVPTPSPQALGWKQPSNYARKGRNLSFIRDDDTLAAFLSGCPKEGEWVYRISNPTYNQDIELTDQNQLQYIVRVITAINSPELGFNLNTGFPETHQLISSKPYSTGEHYMRWVDIRDYNRVDDTHFKRFVDDQLQDSVQAAIKRLKEASQT